MHEPQKLLEKGPEKDLLAKLLEALGVEDEGPLPRPPDIRQDMPMPAEEAGEPVAPLGQGTPLGDLATGAGEWIGDRMEAAQRIPELIRDILGMKTRKAGVDLQAEGEKAKQEKMQKLLEEITRKKLEGASGGIQRELR